MGPVCGRVHDPRRGRPAAAPQNSNIGPCSNPFLAQTTDSGQSWQACLPGFSAATAPEAFTAENVNLAYGASRPKGHYLVGLQNSETEQTPGIPNGVWFYQSP